MKKILIAAALVLMAGPAFAGASFLGGNVRSINVIDVTVDIGSVAANTTEEEEVTVPGVKTGDIVFVSKPSVEAGLVFGSARVSAANTVQITVGNFTGGGINEASETLKFLVVRPEAAGEIVSD